MKMHDRSIAVSEVEKVKVDCIHHAAVNLSCDENHTKK